MDKFENEHVKTIKKTNKLNLNKNYAPNPLPAGLRSETNELFESRQSSTRAKHAIKEWQTRNLQIEANQKMNKEVISDKKSRRQHQVNGFMKRVEERKEIYKEYYSVPSNISAVLDLAKGSKSYAERIQHYSATHKCLHGNRFTGYNLVTNVKKTGETRDVYLTPTCQCALEKETSTSVEFPCHNCSAKTLRVCKNYSTYPADHIYRCMRCKTTYYHIIGWTQVRIHNLTTVKEKPKLVETLKQWAPVPTYEPILDPFASLTPEVKEVVTSIIGEVDVDTTTKTSFVSGNAFEKLKALQNNAGKRVNFFDSVKDEAFDLKSFLGACGDLIGKFTAAFNFLKMRVAVVVVKETAATFLDEIAKVIKILIDKVSVDAVNVSYLLYRLLSTENTLERVVVAGLLGINLPNLSIFKTPIANPAFHRPHFNARNGYFENHLAAANAAINGGNTNETVVTDEDYQSMPDDVQEESGIFGMLGLSSIIPTTRTGLELIKNFNAMFSGWKNLHELVMQLFDRLPSWITSLFEITDPRKRFAKESSTPGNPVYDMVIAYRELLTVAGCSSPECHAKFEELWKISRDYILVEYAPNDLVQRTHHAFLTGARAIMKPYMAGGRPIPFVVTLFGPPGTGKSSSWPLLLSKLVGGDVQTVRGMSYTRNTASEYFDGYNPQKHPIFVMDDVFSQIDDDGATELMSIVTNADFLPPYASLNDPSIGVKGTSFDSPIVVLCSNFDDAGHCKQIADKTALMRRLGIMIHVTGQIVDENTSYKVTEMDYTGKQRDIINQRTNDHMFTVVEIQDLLYQRYKIHYSAQDDRNAKLNKLRVPGVTGFNFRKVYDDSRTNVVRNEFGFFDIVRYTSSLHSLCTEYLDIMKYIGICSAVFAAAWLALRMFATKSESGEGTAAKPSKPSSFSRIAFKNENGVNDRIIIKKILQNQVILVSKQMTFVHGLFVSGRVLLTVKHFSSHLTEGFSLLSTRSTDPEIHQINKSDFRIHPIVDSGLILVECPVYVQPYPNILSHITENVPGKTQPGYVSRTTLEYTSEICITDISPCNQTVYHTNTGTFRTFNGLSYRYSHADGDCGNVVFTHTDGNLKIVGMHDLGSTTDDLKSMAIILNRGEIAKALSAMASESVMEQAGDFPHETALIVGSGKFLNKTQLICASEQHVYSSPKTQLMPSTISGKVAEVTMKPALLHKTREHDPMEKAMSKLGKNSKQFPTELVDLAVQSIIEEIMPLKRDDDLDRILTVSEVLNGIPGLVESTDTSTSSGYPFCLDPRKRGPKTKLLEGSPGSWKLGPEATSEYNRWLDNMEQNIIPNDPFMATLKDEKRPIEKVEQGKTRVFCAGSITGFTFNKQYFGGFATFAKRIREKSFFTIGMNRASLEWQTMVKRYLEVGDEALDGDQENWDGSLKSGLAFAALKVIEAFYTRSTESDRKIRHALFCHAVFTMIRITWIFDGKMMSFIIRVPGCMPSGWFLTLLVNTIVNALLFRIAWLAIVPLPMNDLHYFRKFARDKFTGDDSLVAVAREFLQYFNNVTIAEFFAQYGQTYTAADKSGQLIEYKKLQDCVFCKVRTGTLDDRFVPLMDMRANLETLNWIRRCDDVEEATESNANDVLRNLFFYGRAVFDNYRQLILNVAPTFSLITYDTLHMAFFSIGAIPDPHGTFTFSPRNIRDASSIVNAIKKITISNFQQVKDEVGDLLTMDSQKVTSSKDYLIQVRHQLHQLQTEVDKLCTRAKSFGIENLLTTGIPETHSTQGFDKCKMNEFTQFQLRFNRSFPKYAQLKGEELRVECYMNNEWQRRELQKRITLLGENDEQTPHLKNALLEVEKLMDLLATPPKLDFVKDEGGSGVVKISPTTFEKQLQLEFCSDEYLEQLQEYYSECRMECNEPFGCDSCYAKKRELMRVRHYRIARQQLQDNLELQVLHGPSDALRENFIQVTDRIRALLEPVRNESGSLVGSEPATTSGDVANLDQAEPQITSSAGVHLAEQQQTVNVHPIDGHVGIDIARADAHLKDSDWDLNKMLVRENLVGAFAWALTDASGSELPIVPAMTLLNVPQDLLQNALVAAPFTRFIYWRCKAVMVRFQLVASRFHQGRLGVYYVPTMVPKGNITLGHQFGPVRYSTVQHGYLDPANGTVLDILIPFVHPKGWIDLVFGDVLGQLHCQVLNKLQAATGASTSVEVKVFVSFVENHFRIPRPSGSAFRSLLETFAKEHGLRIVDEKIESVRHESGTFSNLGSSLGGELDKIAESILPAEVVSAAGGICLDKPAVTEFPLPLVHKDQAYMTSSRGIENLERMSLDPSAQFLTADQFGDTIDEMEIKHLISKNQYLTTFNWAATDAVGTVKWTTIVSPTHLSNLNTTTAAEPTILEMIGDVFTYWRGSIVFSFDVVGTAFHEGRLDFCNHPSTITPPTTYSSAMSQYVNSQTIRNTNNNVVVRVPFLSDTPWKQVWHRELISDAPDPAKLRAGDFVIGSFTVRVAVPLKSPNNVANNVDVNVFVKAGDDFEFYYLSPRGGNITFISSSRKKKIQRQSIADSDTSFDVVADESGKSTKVAGVKTGDINVLKKEDSDAVTLAVIPSRTRDLKVPHFGENYKSMRECAKRYQPACVMTGLTSSITHVYQTQAQLNLTDQGGIIGMMAECFRLFRGPMNYKVVANVISTNGVNVYMAQSRGFVTVVPNSTVIAHGTPSNISEMFIPTNTYDESRDTDLQPPLVRFSDTHVAEFQLPYNSIYHAQLIDHEFDTASGNYFSNMFYTHNLVTTQYLAANSYTSVNHLYQAFGDETRYGTFIGFPKAMLRTTPNYPN